MVKFSLEMNLQVDHQGSRYNIATRQKGIGNSSLILCIHGLGCAKESFEAVFKDPRFNGYSLLAPDLLGYGDSAKPDGFSYAMDDHATILQTLLLQYKYKDLHLVMHSMGGAIGLLLAQHLPNVKTIVSVEGNLIPEDSGLISKKTASVSFTEFKDSTFDELRETISSTNDIGAKLWFEWTKKSSPLAFYRSAISLMEWSNSGELMKIFQGSGAKKAYIYGEKNGDIPVLQQLGNIETYEIANSGHFVMNDNPEAFCEVLNGLIKE